MEWLCGQCGKTGHADTSEAADKAVRTHVLNEHYYNPPRTDVTAADRARYFAHPAHRR